jgi:hypothetical protein
VLLRALADVRQSYAQFFSWEGADDLAWGRFCMKAGFLFINHRAFFHNAPYVGPNCPYCDPGATQLVSKLAPPSSVRLVRLPRCSCVCLLAVSSFLAGGAADVPYG